MKNKVISSFILFLFICPYLLGQDYVAMAKARNSKVWGYINEKGKWLVKPEYRNCYSFSKDGWALIYRKEEGGYFFINTKNERMPVEVEEFNVMKIGTKEIMEGYSISQIPLIDFEDGLCPINKKGKWGFIDTKGKLVHQFKYKRIYAFDDGVATARAGKEFFILGKDGKEIKVTTEIVMIGAISEGMAIYKNKSNLAGYLDRDGNVAIYPRFMSVGPFVGGLAWAKEKGSHMIGFINKKGEWVIKPVFSVASEFDLIAGLARVKRMGNWGYVNKNGEILKLKIKTETYSKFKDGLAKGEYKGKFGFFNNKGEWAIKPEYNAFGIYYEGYVPAEQKKRWGILDSKGNWITKPTFEMIREVIPLE
jgi:hypothetical protein